MRLGLQILTVAIALILIVGVVSGVWTWMAGQAKAENIGPDAALQKSDAPLAPTAMADDDDDEDEDGDDDEDEDGDDEDEDEEDEVELTIDQCPDKVRDTILAEAAGNQIKEIEAETEHGETVYEAEWIADGKEIEIKVAADGTLLKKEIEDADDDDK
ncbi:MAG: hypothetical protein IMZ44_13750 [Planctomycetes bacterium]|nr:hypothetical protein [Planctomycetota bacterium]